jgi:hypothetical protein
LISEGSGAKEHIVKLALKSLPRGQALASYRAHSLLKVVLGHRREVLLELEEYDVSVFVRIHQFPFDFTLLWLDSDSPVACQVINYDICWAPAFTIRVKFPPICPEYFVLFVLSFARLAATIVLARGAKHGRFLARAPKSLIRKFVLKISVQPLEGEVLVHHANPRICQRRCDFSS